MQQYVVGLINLGHECGMGALSEQEIFDCLRDSFRSAIRHCEDLARLPKKGPSYLALRECLGLIEGCARQAAVWRQDWSWFKLGLEIAKVHQMAGDWLRGYKLPNGQRVMIREGQLHPCFMKLAEVLRIGLRKAEEKRTARNYKVGTVLPAAQPGPHRDTVPVGYRKSVGGIIMPGMA